MDADLPKISVTVWEWVNIMIDSLFSSPEHEVLKDADLPKIYRKRNNVRPQHGEVGQGLGSPDPAKDENKSKNRKKRLSLEKIRRKSSDILGDLFSNTSETESDASCFSRKKQSLDKIQRKSNEKLGGLFSNTSETDGDASCFRRKKQSFDKIPRESNEKLGGLFSNTTETESDTTCLSRKKPSLLPRKEEIDDREHKNRPKLKQEHSSRKRFIVSDSSDIDSSVDRLTTRHRKVEATTDKIKIEMKDSACMNDIKFTGDSEPSFEMLTKRHKNMVTKTSTETPCKRKIETKHHSARKNCILDSTDSDSSVDRLTPRHKKVNGKTKRKIEMQGSARKNCILDSSESDSSLERLTKIKKFNSPDTYETPRNKKLIKQSRRKSSLQYTSESDSSVERSRNNSIPDATNSDPSVQTSRRTNSVDKATISKSSSLKPRANRKLVYREGRRRLKRIKDSSDEEKNGSQKYVVFNKETIQVTKHTKLVLEKNPLKIFMIKLSDVEGKEMLQPNVEGKDMLKQKEVSQVVKEEVKESSQWYELSQVQNTDTENSLQDVLQKENKEERGQEIKNEEERGQEIKNEEERGQEIKNEEVGMLTQQTEFRDIKVKTAGVHVDVENTELVHSDLELEKNLLQDYVIVLSDNEDKKENSTPHHQAVIYIDVDETDNEHTEHALEKNSCGVSLADVNEKERYKKKDMFKEGCCFQDNVDLMETDYIKKMKPFFEDISDSNTSSDTSDIDDCSWNENIIQQGVSSANCVFVKESTMIKNAFETLIFKAINPRSSVTMEEDILSFLGGFNNPKDYVTCTSHSRVDRPSLDSATSATITDHNIHVQCNSLALPVNLEDQLTSNSEIVVCADPNISVKYTSPATPILGEEQRSNSAASDQVTNTMFVKLNSPTIPLPWDQRKSNSATTVKCDDKDISRKYISPLIPVGIEDQSTIVSSTTANLTDDLSVKHNSQVVPLPIMEYSTPNSDTIAKVTDRTPVRNIFETLMADQDIDLDSSVFTEEEMLSISIGSLSIEDDDEPSSPSKVNQPTSNTATTANSNDNNILTNCPGPIKDQATLESSTTAAGTDDTVSVKRNTAIIPTPIEDLTTINTDTCAKTMIHISLKSFPVCIAEQIVDYSISDSASNAKVKNKTLPVKHNSPVNEEIVDQLTIKSASTAEVVDSNKSVKCNLLVKSLPNVNLTSSKSVTSAKSDGKSPVMPVLKVNHTSLNSDTNVKYDDCNQSVKLKYPVMPVLSPAPCVQSFKRRKRRQVRCISEKYAAAKFLNFNQQRNIKSSSESDHLLDSHFKDSDNLSTSNMKPPLPQVKVCLLESCFDEGFTHWDYFFDLITKFQDSYLIPSHITEILVHTSLSKSDVPLYHVYNAQNILQKLAKCDLNVSFDLKWSDIDANIRKVLYSDISTVLHCEKYFDMVLDTLKTDLYRRNLTSATEIQQSRACKLLSKDCSLDVSRKVIDYLQQVLHVLANNQMEDEGSSKLMKLLHLLQELLELAIEISSCCKDRAVDIATRLKGIYIYLPNMDSKRLLLHSIRSELLLFYLVELVLEFELDGTRPLCESSLQDVMSSFAKAIPYTDITPPTTPKEKKVPLTKLLLRYQPDEVEEIAMLQYLVTKSYINVAKEKLDKSLNLRCLHLPKCQSLPMGDEEILQKDWSAYISDLTKHIHSLTTEVTWRTSQYLLMMECLADFV